MIHSEWFNIDQRPWEKGVYELGQSLLGVFPPQPMNLYSKYHDHLDLWSAPHAAIEGADTQPVLEHVQPQLFTWWRGLAVKDSVTSDGEIVEPPKDVEQTDIDSMARDFIDSSDGAAT